MSKKILFLVTEDWYFWSHRLPLAQEAKRRGYEVLVATKVDRYGELMRSQGFRVIPLNMQRRSINPFKEISAIKEIVSIYRREKPDIIHQVAMKPVLYGSIAARLTGLRHVVNALAGLGYIFTSNSIKARVLRPVISCCFRFLLNEPGMRLILQNKDDCALFIQKHIVDENKIHLIKGAGVDTAIFHPVPEPKGIPVIVLVSRMLWDKGIKEFVEAAKLLKERKVSARFVLVGDSDLQNPNSVPQSTLQEWSNSGVVEWWGKRKDMPEVFAQASIACLPSFYGEGIPKVLLEASACGLPIVTTDAPGCREVVFDGENGLLVPMRSVVELANALGRLIEDPGLRRRMGDRSRRIAVAEFPVEKVVAETMALYDEMNVPKILFLITEDWYFWSHRLPLAQEAKRRGYEVLVATKVDRYGELIQSQGFRVIPLNMQRSSTNPFKEVSAIIEIVSIYRRERPDIVHQVAMKPVLYGSFAARLTGLPHVVNALAGLGYIFTSKGVKARILRPIITYCFKFLLNEPRVRLILQNEDDCSLFIQNAVVGKDKISLIRGSGVDIAIFHPAPEPEGIPVIVFVSRMLWDKGIKEFVEAAKLLKERKVSARFVLVGDSDSHNPNSVPRRILQEWSSSGVVEWWGHKENISEVFAQATVMCLPTYREGVPKVLLEAAACGRPIVTTNAPGCRDVVRHEENGLLVPVRSIAELADTLQRLIEDPELRRRMGARGREIVVEEFTVEKVVAETMGLYEELLHQ